MAADGRLAPDLRHGAIVNRGRAGNAWATEIQSVLIERRDGAEERFHLSHECRKERVPFAGEGDDGAIFIRDSAYEFLTYSRGSRYHQVLSSDTVMPAEALSRVGVLRSGDSLFALPHSDPTCLSTVDCPDRAVRIVGPAEARADLGTRRLPVRELFLRLDWQAESAAVTLFAPCRYVNFSPPGHPTPYVQPITGKVLVPFAGTHLAGYLACALADDGRMRCEVALPRLVEVFGLAALLPGLPEPARAAARTLSEARAGYVQRLDVVFVLDGRLEFFVYA